MLQMRILSSLHRVFPSDCPDVSLAHFTAAGNEPLSFQAAFRIAGTEEKVRRVNVRTETALPLSTYLVGYVPVLHTDTDGLTGLPAPGLFGDLLLEKTTNPELVYEGAPWGREYYEKGEETLVIAADDCWQSLWFTVNEHRQDVAPGLYPVTVTLESTVDRAVLAQCRLDVEILPVRLEKQTLLYTNWFHCDCLADFYGVEMFSDHFFEIMHDFIEKAARNGMNMLLLPAFTPPLDTCIGSERRTAQLVRIRRDGERYSFDFSLMKRYLDVARDAGVATFEHAQLFSQWGALAAPKIVATVNGREQRIFGWDTDAAGEDYARFLRAYLPQLTAFLRAEGLQGRVLFHISDEPTDANEAAYARAKAVVSDLLEGWMLGDPLADYRFYENSLVPTPICATDAIDAFLGRCDHLWAYYTGGQLRGGLSNRVLITPPERNRMLGVQLYYHRIEGFLHWGYNYYYDKLSHGLFDPRTNPCGFGNHAGTSYCVYPGRKGDAIQSVRQKVFAEGLDDQRALQTLEKRKGRAYCEQLIHAHFGTPSFRTAPDSPEAMLAFREAVNRALAE